MKTPLQFFACLCIALSLPGTGHSQPAWTAAASFGFDATPRNNACAMAIGTKGYIGNGFFNSHFYNDFYEYDPSTNQWSQKAGFGGTQRSGATAFSIGTKGYIGLGYDGVSYKNDFWEYDQTTDSWTQKANFGGVARSGAVGFSIGTKGYFGTGYDGSVRKNDFWEYDQNNNAWTQKTNFGGVGRSGAVGFSIGTKGYIGTGYDGTSRKNDFWEYDQTGNSWTQKAAFGGTVRSNAVGFSIGTKGYIGTGLDGTGAYKNDFWEYSQLNNTWTQKAAFGGAGRYGSTGFSIGTKGYIGTGFDGMNYKYDFWEYDQTGNSWTQKTTFGGYARTGAISFSISDEGYFGTGFDGSVYKNDFWQYDPIGNSWTQKANFSGGARTGAVGFTINSKGYVGTGYNGAYLNDFWEYDPIGNAWTQKTNYGGAARQEAAAFVIGSKAYVGTGSSTATKNDFWQYDQVSGNWTQKAVFPGAARQEATCFSINSLGYLATGIDNDGLSYGDLWQYDPNADAWAQLADLPGGSRRGSVSITMNGKGYVATGLDDNDINKSDVWEYDPTSNNWAQKSDFAGNARNSAIFFQANGYGYLGFGDDGNIIKNDLWKFNPLNTISLASSVCAGSNVAINFSTSNIFLTGNIFTAQLSDSNGNFTNPQTIGTLSGTTSGTINGLIPSGTTAGNNYLIRIISSNPSQNIVTSGQVTIKTPPVITSCPGNVTSQAALGLCSNTVNYSAATASGVPAPSITYSQNSGTSFNVGINNVIVTATNTCGVATCNFSVGVSDNQLPVINCPSNKTVNANAANCTATGVNLGTPSTSDNCGIASTTNDAPSSFPFGMTTVTWTTTDVNGNSASCTQTVNVVDNQNPTITCPSTVIVNANAGQCSAGGVNLGTPTATDNCGIASVTNNAPSVFPVGNTTVIWTATDVHGNTATCNQTVTVVDNQNPFITCPSNVNVNANSGQCSAGGVNLGTPTTSDNCGIASVTNNAPSVFPVGNTAVIWTATDVHGNTATCNQIVTVIDNQNPVITCPGTVNVNANAGQCSAGGVNLGTPTTSDNCGIASVTNNAPSVFPVGNTTVIWTATDVHGNTATCNQTVTVVDNQLPVISGCPSNIVSATNPVSWTPPTASDNCGIASFTSNHNPGDSFPIGTTTVTYTATDVHGNISTCSFTVTVAVASYIISASGPTTFCKPGSVTLTVSPAAASYKWYKNNVAINGATAISYTATVTGNYLCKVNAALISTNTISVTASTAPVATISPAGTVNICAGQNTTLSANTGTGLMYQWIKNNVNISGATASTYITSQKGTYKVKVTNSSNCSKTSKATKVAITCKEDLVAAISELNVYPNPTSGIITLQYQVSNIDGASLTIIDLLGRVVYSTTALSTEGTLTIDLSKEPAGMYLVRLKTEAATEVKRVEVVR